MKGVILAGGKGTRLYPYTKAVNKHLLPLGPKCMIDYPLETLIQLHCDPILVVTGGEHIGAFLNYLGSGRERGISIYYTVQEQPLGIADALRYAESFICPDSLFAVILGDNYFADNLAEKLTLRDQKDRKAHIFLKDHPDWHRFGVAEMDINQNKIQRIIEKPLGFISSFVVTGCYILTDAVFEIIPGLKLSHRGEYEITDILNWYAKNDLLEYHLLDGYWSDMGLRVSRNRVEKYLEQKELEKQTKIST